MRERTIVLLSILMAGTRATARVPTAMDPWDDEDDRREYERDQRKDIRSLERGWTWAVMPPVDHGDEGGGPLGVDEDGAHRVVRVTALAITPSGEALVGGEVRGTVRLGTTLVAPTAALRGFVGAVNAGGRFRMIQLGERESSATPSALAVDRARRIVAAYDDGTLALMTPGGRTLWSVRLPPARALAFAANGDVLASGCFRQRHRASGAMSKNTWIVEKDSDGYVARVSAQGGIAWFYRFDREDQRFFDRAADRLFYRLDGGSVEDCGSGIAAGPDGDVFVAGRYAGALRADRPEDPSLPPAGSFLARFTGDGRPRWSRLIAPSHRDPVSLAMGGAAGPIVVAGPVVRNDDGPSAAAGAVAFDLDGTPRWSLAVQPVTAPPRGSDDGIEQLVVAVAAGSDPGFFLAGLHRTPIQLGRRTLAAAGAGIFLARVGEDGAPLSLSEASPRDRKGEGPGDAALTVILGTGRERGAWLAGTMRVWTSGGWAQRVAAR